MIERSIFYNRLNNHCKLCEHWRGVCLKGHDLSSPLGCPIKKFTPVDDAGYAVENAPAPPAPRMVDCCGGNAAMPPLTWTQVFASFTKSMVEWIKAGAPLVSSEVHGQRYDQCKNCTRFRNFYCEHCKCIAYLKTKLATEQCPLPAPRWLSATDRDV